MSKYKGLFTFDVENHRFVPIEQADGIITEMNYQPKDPLIDNKEIREIIRPWAEVNGATELKYDAVENALEDISRNIISFNRALGLKDGRSYLITELCGEVEDA